MCVIEQRAHAVEPFRAEELFVVHAASCLFMNSVSLGRNVSELMVKRHLCLVVKANLAVCFFEKTKFYQCKFYRVGLLDVPFDLGGSIISTTEKAFG